MLPIGDVHLAITFTLSSKLLIYLSIEHSLSRVQVKYNEFMADHFYDRAT